MDKLAERRTVRPLRQRGPLGAVLDLFSSVWLGVTLISVLFVYMSVGSALPLVRESRLFEMTEFEWFNWWPLGLLIALICVNITVATLRRIPFNTVKLGVWMIHTGIVALCASGWWYFSTKIEGDTPVIRRAVVASVEGVGGARLPALPGASTTIGEGDERYTLSIASVDPEWPILSGADEGAETFSVSVMVESPERRFVRQLLDGYPRYTEDVIPGRGRAVKAVGEKILDESLTLGLEMEPQEWYYLVHSRALYLREVGEREWTQVPVRGLPRYNAYLEDPATEAWLAPGDAVPPSAPLDVTIDAPGFGEPLRASGYVRYGFLDARYRPGGPETNPAVTVRVAPAGSRPSVAQLAARDPQRRSAGGGAVAMREIGEEGELEAMLERARGRLRFTVGDDVFDEPIERTMTDGGAEAELPFEALGETGFAYRVRLAADDLTMPGGRTLSASVVQLRPPGGEVFTRLVTADGSVVRDIVMDESGEPVEATAPDARIGVEYERGELPGRATLVAGPEDDRLRVIETHRSGSPTVREIAVGESFAMADGGTVELREWMPRARLVEKPAIVPRRQRDRSAGATFSMVRLDVPGAGEKWLAYHEYVFPGPEYEYPGRFRYEPAVFELADGRKVEAIFSRERRRLPGPAVLEDFRLRAHVGGFTGSTSSIRDWISEVRFRTGDGLTDPVEIRTNAPGAFGGLSYFQARWDPPQTGETGARSAGFAFTGLGVGNRNGVYAMLASTCLAVLGMIYTFYVKPAIVRRRVRKAAARAGAQRGEAAEADERRELAPVGAE